MRALMSAMREYGATELVLGETRIVLHATPPRPLRRGHTTAPGHAGSDDDDVDRELSELEKAESAWTCYWSRLVRSSGAPVPPFPGLDRYKALMNA